MAIFINGIAYLHMRKINTPKPPHPHSALMDYLPEDIVVLVDCVELEFKASQGIVDHHL